MVSAGEGQGEGRPIVLRDQDNIQKEKCMKMNSVRQVLILGATFLLALAPLQAKTGGCSTSATAGNWAYTYTGTIFTQNGPLPIASVGHYHQDASGNVAGSQARSVGGASGTEDTSGVVSVNED